MRRNDAQFIFSYRLHKKQKATEVAFILHPLVNCQTVLIPYTFCSISCMIKMNDVHNAADKEGWQSFRGSFVYMLLSKDTDPEKVDRFLDGIAKERYARQKVKAAFKLQSLDSITPGPEMWDPIGSGWSYLMLFLTGAITLIVLIPACANYINLSISQSLERMKEIGVRKVMGGRKKQIVMQFIIESTTIVLVALLLSYLKYELIRKDFLAQMVETSPVDLSPTWETFIGFLLFAVLVGIVAGIPNITVSILALLRSLSASSLCCF